MRGGVEEEAQGEYGAPFSYLSTTGQDLTGIEKKWYAKREIEAPVEKGQQIGKLVYYLDGAELGNVEITAAKAIERADYLHYVKQSFGCWLL